MGEDNVTVPKEYIEKYMRDQEMAKRKAACLAEIQDVLSRHNCQMFVAAILTTEGNSFNIDVRPL